ncbi:MAG: hypothetical protein SVJ22_03580 [Halobacteriota archaeon]|nr:hypothetical protein [Halobacteriota archaeon]
MKGYDLNFSIRDIKILAISIMAPSSVLATRFVKYSAIGPILTDVTDLGWYLALSKYLISGTLNELTIGNNGGGLKYEWALRRITTFGGYPTASHHVTAAFSEFFSLQIYESYVILQPVCVALVALGLITFIRYYKFGIEVEWLTLSLFLISFFSYTAAWDNHIPLAIAIGPALTATLFGLILAKERFDYKNCILLSIFLAGTCYAYSFYFLFTLLPAAVTLIYHRKLSDIFIKFSVTISTLGLLIPFDFSNVLELSVIFLRSWVYSPIQYILAENGFLSSIDPLTMQEGLRLIENPWGLGYIPNIFTLFGIPFRQKERFAEYFANRVTSLFDPGYIYYVGILIGVVLVFFIILGVIKSRDRYTLLSVPAIFFLIWLYLHLMGRTYYSFRFAVLFGPFIILLFSIGLSSAYHRMNETLHAKIILGSLLSMIIFASLIGLHSGIILYGVNFITEEALELSGAVEEYVGSDENLLLLKDNRELRCERTIVGLLIDHDSLGVLGEQSVSVPGSFNRLPVWHNNSSFVNFHPKDLYDTSVLTIDASYIIAPYLIEESESFANYKLVWNNSKYSLFRRSTDTATIKISPKNPTIVNLRNINTQESREIMINGDLYDLQFVPKTLAIFHEWYPSEVILINITHVNGSLIEYEYDLCYPYILIIPIDGVEELSFQNIDSAVSKLGFSAKSLPKEVIRNISPQEILLDIIFHYDEDNGNIKCTMKSYSDSKSNLVIINQSSRDIISKTPLNVSYPTSVSIEVECLSKDDLIFWVGSEENRTKAFFPHFTNTSNNNYYFRGRMILDRNPKILFP